jgi:hypothetical protein
MEKFKEKAASTTVGNDALWEDPATVQRKQDLERLTTKPFWQGVKIKDGFKNVVKHVLPGFWEDSMAEAKTSKQKLMVELGIYLTLVSKIADKVADKAETECHLPGIDISNMKRTDILALFVKQDATEYLSDARAAAKNMHKLTATLISSGGMETEEQYSFTATAPDNDYYCNYDYDYLFGDDDDDNSDDNSNDNNNDDDANHNNNNITHGDNDDEHTDDNNCNNMNNTSVEVDLGREHLNDMV